MKTIFKCPRSGQYSSKRILAFMFGICAVIAAFVPYVEASITITFATLSLGNQALTKEFKNGTVQQEEQGQPRWSSSESRKINE